MTRSIFDPTGGEMERSGSRNLGPDASNISHMPPSVVDGKTDEDESDAAHADVNEVALTDEEAAERLAAMQQSGDADSKEVNPG
jgi:CCR4-NOT transcriptional regulation complex NOT5 subunit